MIRMISRQLWNQRRQNGWIFAELIIVYFFLWTVIDPIYVLTANLLIDPGYNSKNAYVIKMDRYDYPHINYNEALDNDTLCGKQFLQIARVIRDCPEVESFSISNTASFPNSLSWNGTYFNVDTIRLNSQSYSFVRLEGSNLFSTYGIKDAKTGEEMKIPDDCVAKNKCFISEYTAQLLFGTTDVVGKKIYENQDEQYGSEIAGVFKNYKHKINEQPAPLLIFVSDYLRGRPSMHYNYSIVFRLKEKVNASAFEERFKNEISPQLSAGNFYCSGLESFEKLADSQLEKSGIKNKLRLTYALAGFALLCVFLGMVGTFWTRCNARKQEIGLMRSIGATYGGICNQFMVEAWILVSWATVITSPLVLHYLTQVGFANPTENANPIYWQNQPVAHFCIVTMLTYGVLLATSLLGTYIPVHKAAKILPAAALRDE